MRAIVAIWWRAFSIVSVTALNVTQISGHHFYTAFWTGGLLSFIWWKNARAAAHSTHPYGQYAYAFGAACGTVCGMVLGKLYGG
jgi:hypothetical protein